MKDKDWEDALKWADSNEIAPVRWRTGSLKKCKLCGVEFYSLGKSEGDDYCFRPCEPPALRNLGY